MVTSPRKRRRRQVSLISVVMAGLAALVAWVSNDPRVFQQIFSCLK